jgi:CMP-N-acetylneuraminic acid synthetase
VHILGLITARGGSKGIPHKNIVPVAGRPLLAYTCEAALNSQRLSRVILSTDDELIARVGRENGVEVPFMRPDELASDEATSLDVVLHALRWLEQREGWIADVLVILQPTSPLRRAEHIDQALNEMIKTGADTVVSVVEVPHHFSPYKLMELTDGKLNPFWQNAESPTIRRQDVPPLYARNGPAVLATRVPVLFRNGTFYGEHVIPLVMSDEESIDIDTPFDLRVAEMLLKMRREWQNV